MASSLPISRIRLSESELASRTLSPDHLLSALESLHKNGICVIENAIHTSIVDLLNARLSEDADALYKKRLALHNFGSKTGNIQLAMPLNSELVFNDIIANPFATAVTECMLGPHPVLRFQGGNAAFRAEERQPVHIDMDYACPTIPFGLCINIGLVDVHPENGATEFWPGSHLIVPEVTDPGIIIQPVLEKQRQTNPPLQLSTPKGSIIIRDIKLWHAGMPNHTDDVRILLIGIQVAQWYQNRLKIQLPLVAKEKIQWGNLSPAVDWVDEEAAPSFFSFSDLAPIRHAESRA